MRLIELNEEDWRLVYGELPKGHYLRTTIDNLIQDAMTWGVAEEEFNEQDTDILVALGLECIQ